MLAWRQSLVNEVKGCFALALCPEHHGLPCMPMRVCISNPISHKMAFAPCQHHQSAALFCARFARGIMPRATAWNMDCICGSPAINRAGAAFPQLRVGPPAPENTTLGVCHSGSSAIFLRMKKRRCAPSRPMKGVPGVMQLLSKASSPAGASPARSAAFAACTHACARAFLTFCTTSEATGFRGKTSW